MPTLSDPKGRMETLFVLKKKFRSGRIIRNIYEFADERKYWLKQYRYVINNGICNRGEKYLNSPKISEQRGVKTFRLLSSISHEWAHHVMRYRGLHFYMNEAKDTTRFLELPRNRRRFYNSWGTRIGIARTRYGADRDNEYSSWETICRQYTGTPILEMS